MIVGMLASSIREITVLILCSLQNFLILKALVNSFFILSKKEEVCSSALAKLFVWQQEFTNQIIIYAPSARGDHPWQGRVLQTCKNVTWYHRLEGFV